MFKNFFLSFFVVLTMFLILELIFRISSIQNDFFYEPNTILGSRLKQKKNGQWNTEGNVVEVLTNSYGFRGWDVPQEKTENTFRIAIIGDSYVEAFQVKAEEMISRVLEDQLNKSGKKRIEVLAFGVSGYGTIQEYFLYKNFIKPFHPDIVFLMFDSGNDVRNNVIELEKNPARPYAVLSKDGQVSFSEPQIQSSFFKQANRFFLNHSYFYRFVIERVTRVFFVFQRGEKSGIPIDYFVYECDTTENWENSWNITKAVIKKFRDEVEYDGARFVLVNLSSYFQIHQKDTLRQVMERYPEMNGKCWEQQKPNNILQRWSNEGSFLYLDLLPIFIADYQKTARETHFLKDGHWNVYGHWLAAQSLLKYLEENDFVNFSS